VILRSQNATSRLDIAICDIQLEEPIGHLQLTGPFLAPVSMLVKKGLMDLKCQFGTSSLMFQIGTSSLRSQIVTLETGCFHSPPSCLLRMLVIAEWPYFRTTDPAPGWRLSASQGLQQYQPGNSWRADIRSI
jgi:hypothetical protein